MIAAKVVVHPPFAEEKCEVCHKTQYRPGRNDPSACLSCHKDLADKHAWTHGAVAGGACLWCHSPHESARKWLLRNPDRTLCMQCHSATMMNGSVVPSHIDPKVGCLECHFGHGGNDAQMLKPGATALVIPPAYDPVPASPAAAPAPAPAPTIAPVQPPASPAARTPAGGVK
jgi:predicted CXXCH cytochrome family protein